MTVRKRKNEKALMAATTKAKNEQPNTYLGNSVMNNTTLQTEIQNVSTFQFGESSIRVIAINNEPWFVAKDLCDALGLKNPTQALENLDDDERSMFNIGRSEIHGGGGEVNIVSESGMYTLILRCREAVKKGSVPHRFRKWVTAEVLPQIRKTGQYEAAQRAVKIGKLSKEHQIAIKDLVLGRVKNLPKAQQAAIIIKQWSALKTHFGKSYKEINDDQFVEAVSLLARLPLEGELIINNHTAVLVELEKKFTLELTEQELKNLCWLWKMAELMRQLIGIVQKPLELLGSRLSGSAWGFNHEYKFPI